MIGDGPELVSTAAKPTILYRGRYLYSRNSPEISAVRRLKALELQERTLIIVPSPLLFYGIPELMKELPSQCHILCIETDQQLMALSIAHLPASIQNSPVLTCVRIDDTAQLSRVLADIGLENFRRAFLLPLTGGYALDSETYRKLYTFAEEAIRAVWQNKITSIHMAELWFRNILYNLARLKNISALQQFPVSDLPVVVTGAGISLEDFIPLLHKYRDRFFLLTVDTALPVLAIHELEPDAVCVMEGQFYNMYDFYETGGKIGSKLLSDLSSHPGVPPLFTEKPAVFLSSFSESLLFSRMKKEGLLPPLIPPLGSIGVTALYIAKLLTKGPVFFAGLDFSYTMGKSHAKGSPAHTGLLTRTNRFNPPNQYEACMARPLIPAQFKESSTPDPVTDLVLHSYLRSFNSVIGNDERCYDLSGFGLKNRACRIHSEKDFAGLLEIGELRKNIDPGESGKKHNLGGNSKLVTAFLTNEKDLLDQAVETGTYFLTTRQDDDTASRLIQAFQQVDYVYLHFPDNPPVPKADPGFAKRLLLSAKRYQEIISKALILVGLED